ncbi:MAG TPA: type II toxin-antitoxin system PemK/MazF family toxin [Ktedonobacterales bacterium]|nr:type II toxin-antitoxin system PemK/MazF family toxin [Ktedonobacterales bacterium]
MPHPIFSPDGLTFNRTVEFGGLYWVNFTYPPLPPGMEERRILDWHPALVISSPPFCRHSGAVNVLAVTSYRGKLRPYHYMLYRHDYPELDTDSLVKTELAYPVLRAALADQHFICKLTEHDLQGVLHKVAEVLGITIYYGVDMIDTPL